MKRFTAFLKKEFLHIFRDNRTLMILIGMPVVQVILFGFAITNEVNHAAIGVLDRSHDRLAKELTYKILASDYFSLSQTLRNTREMDEAFKQGDIKVALVIGEDFEKNFASTQPAAIQLLADASDPNMANTLIAYLSAIIMNFQSQQLSGQPDGIINVETRMIYNPQMKSSFYFVPGVVAVLLMLISAMMTSVAIAREKEFGNMEILLVSPLKPVLIILGKSVPYIFLALVDAFIILLIGFTVFDMPAEGGWILLTFELLLFISTSLAIGILISTVAENQQAALLMSMMGLLLPTILLSGFIFPVESMPSILQLLSNLVPAKWFIGILKSILLKGSGWSAVWDETLILAGMTVFFILLSVKNFKTKLA